MRLLNLISSWLLWLVCGFYVLGVTFLRVTDNFSRPKTPPDNLASFVQLSWIGLAMFTALTAGFYIFRQRYWFARSRPAGLGFWVLTVLFYGSVLFVTVAGFTPYFFGDRSSIQWASCVLGAGFVVLGFPRLPPAAATAPLPPPPFPHSEKSPSS